MQQPSGSNSKKMSAKLISLEMEYSIVLKMYEEAYKNYSETLKNSVAVIEEDPCGIFSSSSTNISQACYNKVWKDAGCTTEATEIQPGDSLDQDTLKGLRKNSKLFATLNDDEHNTRCYGSVEGKSATDTSNFAILKGYTFWGKKAISSESSESESDCTTTCANTKNCTGATFNPNSNGKPTCWLRTGEGELMPGMNTDFAIVPEVKKYLLAIESINKKLLETNIKIQMSVKQGQPLYNSIKTKAISQNDELSQNYQQLVMERKKIEKMLSSYQDLDKREINGNLKINQKYYTFILLSIVAICIIILLYKFSSIFSSSQNSSSQNSSPNYVQQGGEINTAFNISGLIIIICIIFIFYFTTIKNTTAAAVGGISGIFGGFFNMIGGIFSVNDDI